jgi:hypothetical protein
MAVIRDVMPAFQLLHTNVDRGCAKVARKSQGTRQWCSREAWIAFDWLKDRIRKPKGGCRPQRGRGNARNSAAERWTRDRRNYHL